MKNDVTKKADELFEAWYYRFVRNPLESDNLIGIIALGKIKGSDVLCRGVSICSAQDQFNKHDGINRALGRMIAAAINKESSAETNCKDGHNTVLMFDEAFKNYNRKHINYKSEYDVKVKKFDIPRTKIEIKGKELKIKN